MITIAPPLMYMAISSAMPILCEGVLTRDNKFIGARHTRAVCGLTHVAPLFHTEDD